MESPRLRFRRLRATDYPLVAPILQDPETMYAWGHGFSYNEVCDWIANMLQRYREEGYGYFAGIHRDTGELIALAGPLSEPVGELGEETADGEEPGEEESDGEEPESVVGIGYIVRRDYWRKNYGMESARAALEYAFDVLNASRVVALIQPTNIPSLHIAADLGMKPIAMIQKEYQGREIPHVVCAVDLPEEEPLLESAGDPDDPKY